MKDYLRTYRRDNLGSITFGLLVEIPGLCYSWKGVAESVAASPIGFVGSGAECEVAYTHLDGRKLCGRWLWYCPSNCWWCYGVKGDNINVGQERSRRRATQ